MELARNGYYIGRARLILQQSFRRISGAAIDAVLYSSEYDFTGAFRFLTDVESRRGAVDGGDGSGQFDGIPPGIKVFIKNKRLKKEVTLTE